VRLWNKLRSDHVPYIYMKNVLTCPLIDVQLILNFVVIIPRFQAFDIHPLFGLSL